MKVLQARFKYLNELQTDKMTRIRIIVCHGCRNIVVHIDLELKNYAYSTTPGYSRPLLR